MDWLICCLLPENRGMCQNKGDVREIGYYEPDENICVINGSTWNGETSKFTVINYDIVQRYYEVPMEPKYTYEEIDNGGKIEKIKVPVMTTDKKTGELVPKMTKSRKKKDIIEALNNSPLFLSKFDCVIIDEAQKLSNNTSIRYNVISDFLSKSNIEYVFLTTGTTILLLSFILYEKQKTKANSHAKSLFQTIKRKTSRLYIRSLQCIMTISFSVTSLQAMRLSA